MDIIQPSISPRLIIVIGSSFICRGRNDSVEEIGLIHVNMAPEIIAITARNDIGLIIGDSSLIIIRGEEVDGAHIVTILNRME